MFVHATLPLSVLARDYDITVHRDCDVAFAAKVPNPLPNRVVPCGAQKHIREVERAEGISGVVTTADLVEFVPEHLGVAVAENPLVAVMDLHEAMAVMDDFQWQGFEKRIDATAQIHPSAIIADRDVDIAAGVVIGPGAIVLERTIIGANCVIGPGTVVGCDAFQVFKKNGAQKVIRQSGGVRLGQNVEIQAKCTVSRAVFGGFTELGDHTILDGQVHVGHDCILGKQVLVANKVSLAGRVTVGDRAYIAPSVTISNGLTIGEGAQITIGSTVLSNVKPDQKVTGYGAQPHEKWMMQTIRAQRQR